MSSVVQSVLMTGLSTAGSTSTTTQKSLGQDDFLKLLVAELQNQNPMEQTDNKQFIAEMAQFSSVEQMSNVAKGLDQLTTLVQSMNLNNLLAEGSSLIDKQITGIDPKTGSTVTGTVSGIRVDSGKVMLEPMEIPLESVTKITKGVI